MSNRHRKLLRSVNGLRRDARAYDASALDNLYVAMNCQGLVLWGRTFELAREAIAADYGEHLLNQALCLDY